MGDPVRLPEASVPLSLELRIDAACCSFEAAWKNGPRIEDYLAAAEEAERGPLLRELLKVELHYRRGERPSAEDYRRRFPEHGPLVESVFEQVSRAAGGAPGPAAGSRAENGPLSTAPELPPQESAQDPLNSAGKLPSIPGYEVLGVLGRGGMGVVYKARQIGLNRLVALKMIRPEAVASPEHRARFRTEAEAVARLQHPNIVQIHEVGEHAGRPFLSLEFMAGGSLGQRLDGTPLPARQAAEMVQALAQAVHHAHQHEIIHRDLKPVNVLLTGDPGTPLGECTPKITDFGLAKKRDDPAGQTLESAILGTPSYMAPEQAAGRVREVSPRTDVYALGAILYECLTGRPPFKGTTVDETLEQVRAQEPVPVRRLRPKVPRDLETICLRCLRKDPRRRYPSARKLADDLRRFLKGEPIRARPSSAAERVVKWARRKPAVAALTLALVLLASAALGTVLWQWRQSQADLARLETNLLYDTRMVSAERYLAANSQARAEEILDQCEPDLRGWEWFYLKRLCQGEIVAVGQHTAPVNSVAFSADGEVLASGSEDGTVTFWNTATGTARLTLSRENSSVRSVTFGGRGKRFAIACADLTVKVWDVTNPKQPRLLQAVPRAGTIAALSHEGNLLASGGQSSPVKIWAPETGRLVRKFQPDVEALCLAFRPDGQWLATGGWGEAAGGIWNVADGRRRAPLPESVGNPVYALAFRPDGEYLATGGQVPSVATEGAVRVWGLKKGPGLHLTGGYTGRCTGVAYSPNGQYLAAAFQDGIVTVWEPGTGKLLYSARRHQGPVSSVAFCPGRDGAYLAFARGTEVVVERWKGAAGREGLTLDTHVRELRNVAFSPDGQQVAGAGADGALKVWDAATGREIHNFRGHDGAARGVAFGPDGKQLASAGEDKMVRLWDLATGGVRKLGEHTAPINSVAFSPDGRRLASADSAGTVRVWDVTAGAAGAPLTEHSAVLCVAFSPNSPAGRYLASASDDGTVKIWDLETHKPFPVLRGHTSAVWGVAFSPDGRWLASASTDQQVKLWDARSGTELRTLHGHTGTVFGVAFSPDGRRLASAGLDATVKIWNTATWQEVLSLSGHPGAVASVAFSPDPDVRRLASASLDGTVKIWDAAPRD
jgi:WD40 repeat protein/tRNA A-37 threonylcarbamoyl transferase component Bud32